MTTVMVRRSGEQGSIDGIFESRDGGVTAGRCAIKYDGTPLGLVQTVSAEGRTHGGKTADQPAGTLGFSPLRGFRLLPVPAGGARPGRAPDGGGRRAPRQHGSARPAAAHSPVRPPVR